MGTVNAPLVGATILAGSSEVCNSRKRSFTHPSRTLGRRRYPAGLAGNASRSGRIVALADAFDALTTTGRTSPPGRPTSDSGDPAALSGTKFDPAIVNVFRLLDLSQLADPAPAPDVAAPHIRHFTTRPACRFPPAQATRLDAGTTTSQSLTILKPGWKLYRSARA
jgi:hypothetical protein